MFVKIANVLKTIVRFLFELAVNTFLIIEKSVDVKCRRTFSKLQFMGKFVIMVSRSCVVRGKRGSNFSVFR